MEYSEMTVRQVINEIEVYMVDACSQVASLMLVNEKGSDVLWRFSDRDIERLRTNGLCYVMDALEGIQTGLRQIERRLLDDQSPIIRSALA